MLYQKFSNFFKFLLLLWSYPQYLLFFILYQDFIRTYDQLLFSRLPLSKHFPKLLLDHLFAMSYLAREFRSNIPSTIIFTSVLGRVFIVYSFTSIVLTTAVSRECFQYSFGKYLLQVLFHHLFSRLFFVLISFRLTIINSAFYEFTLNLCYNIIKALLICKIS